MRSAQNISHIAGGSWGSPGHREDQTIRTPNKPRETAATTQIPTVYRLELRVEAAVYICPNVRYMEHTHQFSNNKQFIREPGHETFFNSSSRSAYTHFHHHSRFANRPIISILRQYMQGVCQGQLPPVMQSMSVIRIKQHIRSYGCKVT